MAHCPMRLFESGKVEMNPFGTYYGKQRHHINRSGDIIPLTYTLIAPQGKSLAPSYNGSRETAVICLLPFEGSLPESGTLSLLTAFADGAWATGENCYLSPFSGDNVTVHTSGSNPDKTKIRSPLLSGIRGNLGKYAVRGIKAICYILSRQRYAAKD